VAQMAHTTILVGVPGMGDDIQAIKAGILEVADLFVVNKADLDGADRTVRELRGMLELRHAAHAAPLDHDAAHRPLGVAFSPIGGSPERVERVEGPAKPAEWEPPILKVIASTGKGVDELLADVERHRAFLESSGERARRERVRAEVQFVALLRERLLRGALDRLEREKGRLTEVAGRIAERKADPYALAQELAGELGG
jgi:GTPase